MSLAAFLQQLVNGLTLGSMYSLVALGYTMVYGIIELINFAHGEIFMFGAFIGLFTLQGLESLGLTNFGVMLTVAFLVSMVITSILGVAVDRIAYKPLRNAPRITALLSAIGVSIFLQNFVMLAFGRDLFPFPRRIIGGVTFGGVRIDNIQIIAVVGSVLLMYLLDLLVRKTLMGKAMRSTAQDMEAASMMGIDSDRIITVTFVIGSSLAAVGGILNGLYYGGIKFDMGFILGLKAFTAAVLGGIGNIRGAMLGGIILGLCETIVVAVMSAVGFAWAFDYKDAISFVVLIIVLILLPSGLMGENVSEKV
ncbi:MAG: branched-chain amino acid ABC transporter permease [bacterium]